MEMRNVVLVVAVLIATASFQTVLSPPGGEPGGNSSSWFAGNSSSSEQYDEQSIFADFNFLPQWFFFLNAIAFTASVGVIVHTLQLKAYTFILHLSLIFLTASYWSSLKGVIVSSFVAFTYFIGTSCYLLWVYYFKILC